MFTMLTLIVYLPEKFFLVHFQNDRKLNYKTGKVEPILSNSVVIN